MDNPGLKTHGSPEPFLKVSNRRYANLVMNQPMTDSTESGLLYNDQMDPLMPSNVDKTLHEDVTTPPPLAGGATSLPVPATNGEMTQDRSVNLRQHMAGNPTTLVPGTMNSPMKPKQKPGVVSPSQQYKVPDHTLEDQQNALNQATTQERITVQKGDGTQQNRKYQDAQRGITEHLEQKKIRPIPPVHAAEDNSYEVDPDEIGYLGARDFYHIPLRERPWEVSDQADDFDARVKEIMETAQHEGIREPLDVFGPLMHNGAHRWEAARRLGIPVRIVRRGMLHEGYHDTRDDLGRFAPKGTTKRETLKPKPGKFDQAKQQLGETEAMAWDRLRREHPDVAIGPDESYADHYTRLKAADRKKNPRKRQHNKIIHHVGHHDPTQDMHDLMDVQGSDGNWDYDPYMHGMFNGMELMRAIHDRDDPQFREAPKKWLYESAVQPELRVEDYSGREGNNSHITRNEYGHVPLSWISRLKGGMGERPDEHRNYHGDEWEHFKSQVAAGAPGYSDPIFIVVNHGEEPRIYEGNHRRDAYKANALAAGQLMADTRVPVQVRYFGHAEKMGTLGDRFAGMTHTATQNEEEDSYGENEITPEERDQMEQNPRGYLEGLINGLPEAGSGQSSLPFTRASHQEKSTLAGAGFEKVIDPDDWDQTWPQWTKDGVTIRPSWEHPRGGFWETMHGDAEPVFHLDFQTAFNHVTRRPEPRTPGKMVPFQPSSRPNPKMESLSAEQPPLGSRTAETDEEFWARQPDVVQDMGVSPDAHQEAFMEPGDVEHDLEDAIPRNTLLREHAHVLRNGFRWDGDERYPKYTQEHHRNIMDSDDRPAYAKEGHVIERNTHVLSPVFSTVDDPRPSPLAHPWMHTYYPAGQNDDEGLVAGYNTAEAATRAAHQLSLWGARHPDSQELLSRYQYVGDGTQYDAGEELPHEKAQRMGHV